MHCTQGSIRSTICKGLINPNANKRLRIDHHLGFSGFPFSMLDTMFVTTDGKKSLSIKHLSAII